MGVKPMATYALSKLDPPKSFADFCGQHHDADADTPAVYVILFDQKQFGRHGLHHCVFYSNRKCFQPIEEVRSAMQIKMCNPVLEMETLPRGWVPAPVNTTNSHITTRSKLDLVVLKPFSRCLVVLKHLLVDI